MTKEVYERVDLEIIQFQTDDVITTSIPYKQTGQRSSPAKKAPLGRFFH